MREREPQPPPMELTRDYEYAFHGLWTEGGVCRIRTFEAQGRVPVVIAMELPSNENTSVTNMAEYLAAEILDQYFADRIGSPAPLTWIEHYPERVHGRERIPEEYDLVRFERTVPIDVCVGGRWRRSLGEPQWRSLGKPAVEQILGQHLNDRPSPHTGSTKRGGGDDR